MWLFGYGSLMWKVDFPYECKLVGYVKGYVRRFWQGSEDHRGVPGSPGRVVTLVRSDNPEDCVWGVAYKIRKVDIDHVTAHLDHREKGGYERVAVTFHPESGSNVEPFNLTIYVGHRDNPYFLGPDKLELVARQILTSEGPSGKNRDYLFKLAETMRQLAPSIVDEHLYELESAVRKLETERGDMQNGNSEESRQY